MKDAFEQILNRNLTNIELQIWMAPRICEICRFSQQNELIDCVICYSASYCSTEHKIQHAYIHDKFCKQLKICYEINKKLFYNLEYPKVQIISNTIEEFPEDITEYLHKYTKQHDTNEINDILATNDLSPALTILFSLFHPLKTFEFTNNLTIHMIGASFYERFFDWSIFSDVIIKNTSVQTLRVDLIGPEIPHVQTFIKLNNEHITINLHLDYYENFIQSQHYTTPDVIIAFNSGFHEYIKGSDFDTWSNAIKMIFDKNNFGCFIFTSYTENEAELDFDRVVPFLEKSNMEVVLKCQKNKFASLRPIRDFYTENVPIFYNNNYVSVIKNKEYVVD